MILETYSQGYEQRLKTFLELTAAFYSTLKKSPTKLSYYSFIHSSCCEMRTNQKVF